MNGKKHFFRTNAETFFSNPILKDIYNKTFVLVDNIPHTITEEEEPCTPLYHSEIIDNYNEKIEFLYEIERLKNSKEYHKEKILKIEKQIQKFKKKL
jgi:hypothetical protein